MKPDQALELRPGETDKFYFLFTDELATGDELIGTPTVTSDGATIANVQRNSQALELEGVTYRTNTVVSCDVSAVTLGDRVELVCEATTSTGRIMRESGWIDAVEHYGRND